MHRGALNLKTIHKAEQYAHSFQNGDEKAFAYFFRALYPVLTSYCFSLTGSREISEELVSNAFIKIWQKHERFTNAYSIKAYLYRIVRNDAFKYLQAKKKGAKAFNEVLYLYGNGHQKDHFTSLVKSETLRQLSEAMNTLPTECAKVFRLLYIEGKSIKETATALGLATTTVKTQKARGLAALRKTFPSG